MATTHINLRRSGGDLTFVALGGGAGEHAAAAVTAATGAATTATAMAELARARADDIPAFAGFRDAADLTTLLANSTWRYDATGAAQVVAGDVFRTRKEGFSYVAAASGASDHHLTTAGGLKLKVQTASDGRANIEAFNAIGDDSTNNNTAMSAAIASGLPLYVPAGVFRVSSARALAEGTDILGIGTLRQMTNDTAMFTATSLDYFAVRGITLQGATTSPGSVPGGAITIVGCSDFDVEFCTFDTWPGGGGVWMVGTALLRTSGKVRWNSFKKGDVSGTTSGYGVQDNAGVQVYEYCNNVKIVGNAISGKWYCSIICQDRVGKGSSRIYDLLIEGNECVGASNYGIALYTLGTTITGIANNGSGAFRVSATSHGFVTGDRASVENSGDADGVWTVTTIDADTFDLVDSVYSASTTNGACRASENCAGRVFSNHIEGVEGSREASPGVRPYGAGLYLQAVGGIVATGNVFIRTNLQTNSGTLSPSSIGINGVTGDITISGGYVRGSGYQGITAKSILHKGANVLITDISVQGSARENVFLYFMNNCTLRNVSILEGGGQGTGTHSVRIESCVNVSIEGLFWPRCFGSHRALNMVSCTDFSVRGVHIKNLSPAPVLCELVYFSGCTDGVIQGNYFNGGASAYTALTIEACVNTMVSGNYVKMTPDGSARPCVRMFGTCTGTLYGLDNFAASNRMENSSTGGMMITRDTANASGGKTRQAGDIVFRTNPTAGSQGVWHKTAASAGSSDWQSATIA